jgi:hypothetical protein
MISVELTGRLGNHLHQYAVCRTVAEQCGYDFHIPRYFAGIDLFDCSLGVENDETIYDYYDPREQIYQPDIFKIKDFTKLHGYLQAEHYIINNKKNIQDWFTLKNPNVDLLNQIQLDEHTCVINFRGGDFQNSPLLFLNPKFYVDAVNHMKKINPAMKFIIVTDDPPTARRYLQGFPVYHFSIAEDWLIVNRAKYLIIANSTFSWWAAWLNNNCQFVIAPKYWMRYNVSNLWWDKYHNITTGFFYVDRAGKLSSSNQCIHEQPHFDPTHYPYY